MTYDVQQHFPSVRVFAFRAAAAAFAATAAAFAVAAPGLPAVVPPAAVAEAVALEMLIEAALSAEREARAAHAAVASGPQTAVAAALAAPWT
mmetsp:Transcript_19597/g.68140  ORF Transcript_19597/g.68140 Transcript_19597/m.68140 type:complete len:92 (+) Transcript_19597:312-587(+)